MKYYVADAFYTGMFSGNTASIILPNTTAFPDSETMTSAAMELNLPDTAFAIKSKEKPSAGYESVWDVKYYSSTQEVGYCGHATLALFRCLMDSSNAKPGRAYQLNTKIGKLGILISEVGDVMVEMPRRSVKKSFSDENEILQLYEALNLTADAIDEKCKPEILSTGVDDLIIPVGDIDVLNSITPDFEKVKILSAKYGVSGFHVFAFDPKSPEGYGAYAHARNFSPLIGNNEEAATGAASGALGFYLCRNGYITENHFQNPEKLCRCLFMQGEKMKRDSEIICDIKLLSPLSEASDPDIAISIGGRSKIVVKGDIKLSSF